MSNLVNTIRGMFAPIVEETKVVNEAPEDKQPASPDEAQMAMKQLDFISYAAKELKDHIKSSKEFPEWMQNKLSKLHGQMESLHSAMGEHGSMDESVDISESHFKVGDEVVCKASGMEGEVVAVDPEGKGKYYTVKREDGKTMKYAPDELSMEDEEEMEEQTAVAPAPGDKWKDQAVMVNTKNIRNGKPQRVVIDRENMKNYPAKDGWKEVSPGQNVKKEETVEEEVVAEGLGKDLKRLATRKDVKSRAGQEIAKAQQASMTGDNKTAHKHFKRFDKLDKLANKNQGVSESAGNLELEEATADQINQVLGSTKSASEGLAALKKAFKVDDKGAKALMKKVMGEEVDFDNLEEGWEDMMKAAKERGKTQPNGGAGKKAGRAYGGAKQKDDKKTQTEALHPNQKKLDVDKDGKIEKDDLAKLRAGKKPGSGKAEPVEVNPKMQEETEFLDSLLEGSEMTDAEMKKREKIVKSMKKKTADFKSRYGDRWKSVMYATATKMANK
jgi:hypothetical protein